MVELAAALGIPSRVGDVHICITVAQKRDESYLFRALVEREQDKGIRAAGVALGIVNADKQDVYNILARIFFAAVLRPRRYERVETGGVRRIIHIVELVLGRKGIIRVDLSILIYIDKSDFCKNINTHNHSCKHQYCNCNGYNYLQIFLVVVHEELFCTSFLFAHGTFSFVRAHTRFLFLSYHTMESISTVLYIFGRIHIKRAARKDCSFSFISISETRFWNCSWYSLRSLCSPLRGHKHRCNCTYTCRGSNIRFAHHRRS